MEAGKADLEKQLQRMRRDQENYSLPYGWECYLPKMKAPEFRFAVSCCILPNNTSTSHRKSLEFIYLIMAELTSYFLLINISPPFKRRSLSEF